MKTKHIIAATSAAVIAGSVFYYFARKRSSARALSTVPEKLVNHRRIAEEKIRAVMHHAKDIQSE